MKRIFDLVVTCFGLPFLLPVLVIIAVLVRVKLGSPIIFKQSRPGKGECMFNIIKFRTMINAYDNNGFLLPDNVRLTPFGSFLRSTSFDELPGLWCVIKGDMSIVGPRPLLEEYLPLYSFKHSRRHEVKPGLTGWAQVNGRNLISWDEKFELDLWYVDNQSIWLDIKVLFLTLTKVIKREGISADDDVTMPIFKGYK